MLQNTQIAYCGSEKKKIGDIFRSLICTYVIIVFLMAFFSSFLITKAPQSIKTDISVTRAAAITGIVTFVIASLVEAIALEHIQLVWWCYAVDSVLGYALMMALLVLYQVRVVSTTFMIFVTVVSCSNIGVLHQDCQFTKLNSPLNFNGRLLTQVTFT